MSEALIIFKPDAAYRLKPRAAIWGWLRQQEGVNLQGLQWFQAPTQLVETHYDFLRGRPFFPWLVDFMTALPVIVGRLTAGPDRLERLRYELGETRIQESRPGSLRERYGIFAGINCLHISDSPETGAQETELWARHVSLEHGDAQLEEDSDAPDHTFHLRSLAGQVAAGMHAELAAQEIKKLLKEETRLEGGKFEAFSRIVLGALT